MPLNRNVKFGILEIDGEELETPSEYVAESCDIKYDAADPQSPNLYEKINSLGGSVFKYILDDDLVLENNESKIVANKIICNNNSIRLKGNSILRIS